MTRIYLAPTAVYNLGQVGELALVGAFDGEVVVPDAVVDAVDVEPAATNLDEVIEEGDVAVVTDAEAAERADALLGDTDLGAAASVIAGVLAYRDPEDRDAVAVVAEDRTVRRVSQGLGAAITSGFGVVVRAAVEDKYLKPTQAKRIVRRMDQHGTHMTGELRERAVGELSD